MAVEPGGDRIDCGGELTFLPDVVVRCALYFDKLLVLVTNGIVEPVRMTRCACIICRIPDYQDRRRYLRGAAYTIRI